MFEISDNSGILKVYDSQEKAQFDYDLTVMDVEELIEKYPDLKRSTIKIKKADNCLSDFSIYLKLTMVMADTRKNNH